MSGGIRGGDRRFGLFWLGHTVSQFGDRISELALPLIAVVLLHAGPGETAVLTALLWLPSMVSPLTGAWVDSLARKRTLLVVADLVRALALLSLPAAALVTELGIGQLYIVAAVLGAGRMVFDVAYPAFFVALVPRESYVDANGKLSLSRSLSSVVGPAGGGALVQAITAPVAVVVDALSYLFSAVVIGAIKVRESPPAHDRGAPWHTRIAAGFRCIRDHPLLRASLACSTTMNFFMFAVQAQIILFASNELGLSAGAIGLALGAGAVGGMLGAVAARWFADAVGLGRTMLIGAALYPGPVVLLVVASGPQWINMALLGAMEFLSGFGVMFFDIANNSLRAAVTPDAVRSRVSGAYTAINYGSRPLGALAGGAMATVLGLRPTLLAAAVCGVAGALWLLFSPVRGLAAVPEQPDTESAYRPHVE